MSAAGAEGCKLLDPAQAEAQVTVLERELARLRQESAAEEEGLTAALDELDRLKNTLESATDALLMAQAANTHAQCAHAYTISGSAFWPSDSHAQLFCIFVWQGRL